MDGWWVMRLLVKNGNLRLSYKASCIAAPKADSRNTALTRCAERIEARTDIPPSYLLDDAIATRLSRLTDKLPAIYGLWEVVSIGESLALE